MSSNNIFNINGSGINKLEQILALLLNEYTHRPIKVKGWCIDNEKGFVLYSYVPTNDKKAHLFPAPMNSKWLAPLIMSWLESDEAKAMKCEGWDENLQHDGSNDYGFRVYTEEWGHIHYNKNIDHATIAAIRPAYIWYSK